ncbi:MAG: DSD1 family PLP-dependent enzyme [Rhodospirillales bacterium]|jgi:D-serine deaminase-like pyridoxal phosphate-dependent protein|nr:DSD1 family PLP-dependent enzyme [Rhodospirillales bacterium]MDP7652817.1 DSD1 family PLP-dependent enzyme [Rhodospirillales bacterium]
MTIPPPVEIGLPLEDVDTPALIIELDPFERNLQRIADEVADSAINLRPHVKTHKSADIARRQVDLGAVGVCCQNVSEAEAMVDGGVTDVFVSNEIVDRRKVVRLASLARRARIGVCVDSLDAIATLGDVAQELGVELRVVVEINVGTDRCGVEPGEPALPLARAITEAPGLRFGGLQAYHGPVQHVREFARRRKLIEGSAAKVRRTLEVLERDGLITETVTGAGTASYRFEMESGVFTELQVGTYVFMDTDYTDNQAEDGGPFEDFEQSLFVYTQVVSRPAPQRVLTDASNRAISLDSGLPLVRDTPGLEYEKASDGHGRLILHDMNLDVQVGDKFFLIPAHCNTTANLYDHYLGIRDGRVETVWPISSRGPGN